MAKKKAARKVETLPPKLTETELNLLSQLEDGYQLETDSLGGNPVLRRLKDNEVLRPADANASTVKALEQRGLIRLGKGRDPLTISWRLTKKNAGQRPNGWSRVWSFVTRLPPPDSSREYRQNEH